MGKTYQKPDTEWMKGNLPLERIAGATYQLQCDYMGKNHEQISTELILAAMNEAFRRGSQSIQDEKFTEKGRLLNAEETERRNEGQTIPREAEDSPAVPRQAGETPDPSAASSELGGLRERTEVRRQGDGANHSGNAVASKVEQGPGNSPAVKDAIKKTIDELSAMSPEEFRKKLDEVTEPTQTGVEPSKWDSSVWRHPGLSEFFKRYKPGDLVPAAEVRGVADWYEDQIEEAADRFNSKAPTVSPAVRFDAWFKTYFGERPTEAVTKSFSIGNLLQAFHAGAESPAPAVTDATKMLRGLVNRVNVITAKWRHHNFELIDDEDLDLLYARQLEAEKVLAASESARPGDSKDA